MVYETLRFDSECWDDIYKSGDYVSEWLPKIQWEDVRGLLPPTGDHHNHQQPLKFLVAGCGTSQLSRKIFDCEGRPSVISVDISETIVKKMLQTHKGTDYEALEYRTMDVRNMDFKDEVFDYIVDKATFDCMMCSDGRDVDVPMYLSEVFRVLKRGGLFVIMGFTHPLRCSRWIELFEWDMRVEELAFEEPAARPCQYQRNVHHEYFVMLLHKR